MKYKHIEFFSQERQFIPEAKAIGLSCRGSVSLLNNKKGASEETPS